MPVERRALDVEVRTEPGGDARVVVGGVLDVRTAGGARRDLAGKLSRERLTALSVDASALESADLAGVSLLWELAHGRLVPGVGAEISGLRPDVADRVGREISVAVIEPFEILEDPGHLLIRGRAGRVGDAGWDEIAAEHVVDPFAGCGLLRDDVTVRW